MRSKLNVPSGGRAFHVFMHTNASATIPVILTAEDLAKVAENLGTSVDKLTSDDLFDTLVERAANNTPTLCHHCAGGHYATEPSLALADDWESDAEHDRFPVKPSEAVSEIKPKQAGSDN